MSTIQIRDLNTAKVYSTRQISEDAGIFQIKRVAEKMANRLEHHNDFLYAVVVDKNGVAKRKFLIGEV